MGKSKWATSKLLIPNRKDIKEFRSYYKFISKEVLNYENVFAEYISDFNYNETGEFSPHAFLGMRFFSFSIINYHY